MSTVIARSAATAAIAAVLPLLSATLLAVAGDARLAAADATAPQTGAQAMPQTMSQTIALGDFATGTDGFSEFSQDATGGKVGKACVVLTNPRDGWIEGGKDFPGMNHDVTQLRFWAKSTTARTIAVRLTDRTGQSFQHRLGLLAGAGDRRPGRRRAELGRGQ